MSSQKIVVGDFNVFPIRIFSDNYAYMVGVSREEFMLVDAADPITVLSFLPVAGRVSAIFTTHRHLDHSQGNDFLKDRFPEVSQYGGKGAGTIVLKDKERIFPFKTLKHSILCLHTPCHTKEHFCYVLQEEEKALAVFTGDTLFLGGCGRFFEGDAAQMHLALKRLKELGDVLVFPGHEYTLSNLCFGIQVEPENKKLRDRFETGRKQEDWSSLPGKMSEEEETNPFLRCHISAVKRFTGKENSIKVLEVLREKKDLFKQ